MSTHQYEKSVDVARLTQEIRNSSIAVALSKVRTTGSTVTITFKASLSPSEEDVLDDIIANHVNTPLPGNEVQMVEIYQGPIGTNGNYRVNGKRFDIPARETLTDDEDDEVVFDWSWPVPIRVFTASWVEKPEHESAIVNLEISPDTPVGQLTGPTTVDDPWIDVNEAALAHLMPGFHLGLWDGGSTSVELGSIIEIDYDNNRVKLTNAPQSVWPASSVVRLTVRMAKDLVLNGVPVPRKIGGGKVGGSFVAANTVLRLRYRRMVPNAEPIYLSVQFELDY